MDRYLTILTDSLEKKSQLLDRVSEICEEHEKIITSESPDMDAYNTLMEEKGGIIEELNLLDDGFTALYERVSPALREDPSPYADKLIRIKQLVAEISDKTAVIQAKELRIHSTIDRLIKSSKTESRRFTPPSDAAYKYYQTMNNTNMTTSVFVDSKKK